MHRLRLFACVCFFLLAALPAVASAQTTSTAQHRHDPDNAWNDGGWDDGDWGDNSWDDNGDMPSTDDSDRGSSDWDNNWDDNGTGNGDMNNGGSGGNTGTDNGESNNGNVGSGNNNPTTPETDPNLVPVTGTYVKGKVARMRKDGKAAIPRGAPLRVRRIIAAANKIVGKPYKWGGGHAKLIDRGYDCSGTVSYALIRSGELGSPLVSGSFAKWGTRGKGKWTSIYANKGHVYMEVAGLRLDTSSVGDPGGRSGVRWRPIIGKRTGFHTRHVKGL